MKIPQRKRKVTTITLDPKIVEKAKKYNLNISRLSEDSLKEMIKKLEHEAEPMGSHIEKKGGEKEMTSKLPWAAAVIIIVAAAGLGAWAIWGGAPTATTPSGAATITAITGPGTVFGYVGNSYIENVYIIQHGVGVNENLNLHDNTYLLGTITANAGIASIPYENSFDIVVAVKVTSPDNMAYARIDNMNVGLAGSGTFTITEDNAQSPGHLGTQCHMAAYSFDNSNYGTTSGYLRINAIWDNNGQGYKLIANGTLDLTNIKLWGWK